jgi:hypothetical protein
MQNDKTLASIRDLFQLLQSSGALLGRTRMHIVLDRQAMPEIVDGWVDADRALNRLDCLDF